MKVSFMLGLVVVMVMCLLPGGESHYGRGIRGRGVGGRGIRGKGISGRGVRLQRLLGGGGSGFGPGGGLGGGFGGPGGGINLPALPPGAGLPGGPVPWPPGVPYQTQSPQAQNIGQFLQQPPMNSIVGDEQCLEEGDPCVMGKEECCDGLTCLYADEGVGYCSSKPPPCSFNDPYNRCPVQPGSFSPQQWGK